MRNVAALGNARGGEVFGMPNTLYAKLRLRVSYPTLTSIPHYLY